MKLIDIVYESVIDMYEGSPIPMQNDEFIKRAQNIHKDENGKPKYDYSKTDYVNRRTKVIITCPLHGDFIQSSNGHLRGDGCPSCGKEKRRLSRDEFIKKSKEVHGDKYTYDNVVMGLNNSTDKVSITCPIHGDFLQPASDHIRGNGCKKCVSDTYRTTKDDFIKNARKIHGDKYSYDHVNYKNTHTPVTITCPLHGDFSQTPAKHLYQGCPKCIIVSRGEIVLRDFFTEQNFKFVEQKKFDACFNFNKDTKKCFKLPFDFYLPDINTLIEVDGAPHFKIISKFGETKFERQVLSDKIKNQFVKNSSYRLIRLFYDGRNFKFLLSELDRLLNKKSSEKILLSKDYPKEGWNK